MDKKPYDPSDIEQKLYKAWEDSGLFAPGDNPEAYSLAIPPPNVTGTLHMGHGFQNAIMDCLIRYHRMSGKNTCTFALSLQRVKNTIPYYIPY